jgi:DNA polymerase-4
VATHVLHVDVDEFIAAVEVLRRPELKGKPVVVGGDGDPTKRGVVSTASYEARAFGVRSGMPLRTAARRCPDAVFVAVDRDAYERASKGVMATLGEIDGVLEVAGWDEAFLEVNADDPEAVAREIKGALRARTGLSCAVGIGDNKLRAKLATALAKPGGVFRLTRANWDEVMGARPADSLWGVGRKTARRLADLGIRTVDDLARADEELLAGAFGPGTGPWLRRLGRGEHLGRVSAEPHVAKSHSKEMTFQVDLTDRGEIEGEIERLARALAGDIAARGRVIRAVALKVRFAPFDTQSHSARLEAPTRDPVAFARGALGLLDRFELDRPVRLLGVRADLAPPEERE